MFQVFITLSAMEYRALRYIFTSCYFHTVKIAKVLFSHCEINKVKITSDWDLTSCIVKVSKI